MTAAQTHIRNVICTALYISGDFHDAPQPRFAVVLWKVSLLYWERLYSGHMEKLPHCWFLKMLLCCKFHVNQPIQKYDRARFSLSVSLITFILGLCCDVLCWWDRTSCEVFNTSGSLVLRTWQDLFWLWLEPFWGLQSLCSGTFVGFRKLPEVFWKKKILFFGLRTACVGLRKTPELDLWTSPVAYGSSGQVV